MAVAEVVVTEMVRGEPLRFVNVVRPPGMLIDGIVKSPMIFTQSHHSVPSDVMLQS
jgi:hypothetical protein